MINFTALFGDVPASVVTAANFLAKDGDWRATIHYAMLRKIEAESTSERKLELANKYSRILNTLDAFAFDEEYRNKVFKSFAELLQCADSLVQKIVDIPEKILSEEDELENYDDEVDDTLKSN